MQFMRNVYDLIRTRLWLQHMRRYLPFELRLLKLFVRVDGDPGVVSTIRNVHATTALVRLRGIARRCSADLRISGRFCAAGSGGCFAADAGSGSNAGHRTASELELGGRDDRQSAERRRYTPAASSTAAGSG